MRFTVAATAALIAGANAWGNSTGPVYTTEVVTAYTTYCPSPTEITHGGTTYTVTEATTLTITDCPCTITKPVSSAVPTMVPPPADTTLYTPAPYPTGNGTSPSPVSPPAGTGAPGAPEGPGAPGSPVTTSPVATFTGAANKVMGASGAGLAAVFGLAAYIL